MITKWRIVPILNIDNQQLKSLFFQFALCCEELSLCLVRCLGLSINSTMRTYPLLVALVYYLNPLKAEEIRLLDLEPKDAQNIIEKQDQSLKYAPKIESDVPAVRFLGEEPHNVLEDIYLAKQYHGQDGLGGYLYGYEVPDIAKNEEKKATGNLKGAYNYINGAGQEIKVEYWDNGDGFHQVDNIPQVLPQQIAESPEVKAAKDAFLKRWQEEAERNTHPVENPYNSENQYASGPLSVQEQQRKATFNAPKEADNPANDEGRYVPQADEESTGPPKGFFYAFDYPVGIITKDQGRALPAGKSGNLKNVYERNKREFEKQLQQGKASDSSQYLIA